MNNSRREFLKGSTFAVSSAMAVLLLSSRHVCAESRRLPMLCSLQADLGSYNVQIFTTSGNTDIDAIIELERKYLADCFKVSPGFGYYDDDKFSNSYALSKTLMPDSNGTVIFGKKLLAEELKASKWGGLAVAGILAHEFGHIYQQQSEFYYKLTESQPTHVLLELHADFFAGYYLGWSHERKGDFDIMGFANSLYIKGSTDFNSPDHHGTPAERLEAMIKGYKVGLSHKRDSTKNANLHEVAETGMNFVKTKYSKVQ